MTEPNHRGSTSLRPARFEDFYAQSWDSIYRPLAVILGDASLASEAVDEAMTRAYERWSSVSRMENPAGWVYRVAANWARSWLRRAQRVRVLHEASTGWVDQLPEPGLSKAMSELSPAHREVVVLRYLLDWSEADVAEALHVRRGTVKGRLSRAEWVPCCDHTARRGRPASLRDRGRDDPRGSVWPNARLAPSRDSDRDGTLRGGADGGLRRDWGT